MNIITMTFTELTGAQKESFNEFLERIPYDNLDPAKENMWADDWKSKPHTLPYILNNTDRFIHPNGEFNIMFDGDTNIGCGGVYLSVFDHTFAIAGSRTWVNVAYRHKLVLRDNLLAKQKKWATEHNCGAVGLCFNDYNRNLIKVFKRIRLGENKSRITGRLEQHLFYTGVIEIPYTVTVQYTKQWVAYELLNKDWRFDWESIKNV